MKGNISLKDFIDEVKNELITASETDSPFFKMNEVELEVSFGLNAKGKAGAKFVVFEMGAEADALQMHRVKIKLTPFKTEDMKSAGRVTANKKLLPQGKHKPKKNQRELPFVTCNNNRNNSKFSR